MRPPLSPPFSFSLWMHVIGLHGWEHAVVDATACEVAGEAGGAVGEPAGGVGDDDTLPQRRAAEEPRPAAARPRRATRR